MLLGQRGSIRPRNPRRARQQCSSHHAHNAMQNLWGPPIADTFCPCPPPMGIPTLVHGLGYSTLRRKILHVHLVALNSELNVLSMSMEPGARACGDQGGSTPCPGPSFTKSAEELGCVGARFGHFTQFWGGVHYPQSCHTRPNSLRSQVSKSKIGSLN
jgi:hypothetical protein